VTRTVQSLTASGRWCALAATALVGLGVGGCPRGDEAPDGATAVSAAARTASSTSAEPTHTAASVKPTDSFEFDTGRGQDRRADHPAELWEAGVDALALEFQGDGVWWGEARGIFRRPLTGKPRGVVLGSDVGPFAVDDDGLIYVAESSKKLEIRQLPHGAEQTKTLHRPSCRVLELATSEDHVVVASTCEGIYAVPKRGGALRRLEAESHITLHLATDGETLCTVNTPFAVGAGDDDRVTCRSLAEAHTKPRALPAYRPSPLLVEGGEAFWLEEAPAHDVILGGVFGRLMATRIDSGKSRQLAAQQHQSYAIRSDGTALYFFTEMGGLRRVRKDGSKVQTLHHIGKLGSPKLAVGGGYAFFSGGGVRGIHRLRLPKD